MLSRRLEAIGLEVAWVGKVLSRYNCSCLGVWYAYSHAGIEGRLLVVGCVSSTRSTLSADPAGEQSNALVDLHVNEPTCFVQTAWLTRTRFCLLRKILDHDIDSLLHKFLGSSYEMAISLAEMAMQSATQIAMTQGMMKGVCPS